LQRYGNGLFNDHQAVTRCLPLIDSDQWEFGARRLRRTQQDQERNMTENSDRCAAAGDHFDEAATQFASSNKIALHLLMTTQMAMLQEMLFGGFEMFDRAQAEMHLFAEFSSKIASAHSVGDIKTMWEECSHHQLDYIRRDTERLLRHGDQMIETASKLFSSLPRN
jgi:hypothetical protein